jgi:hypothetical protein
MFLYNLAHLKGQHDSILIGGENYETNIHCIVLTTDDIIDFDCMKKLRDRAQRYDLND